MIIRPVLGLLIILLLTTAAIAEPHPKRLTGTSAGLLGAEADAFAEALPPDEPVSWKLYVPDTYSADTPAGLLVFISPVKSGKIPGPWRRVIAEQNLIWMAAEDAGNDVTTLRRMLLAAMAPERAGEAFALDEDRIYVAGFSGGGKTASFVTAMMPGRFDGGVYIGGVEHGGPVEPRPEFYALRHVLITGHNDFNRAPTREVYDAMVAAGAADVKLMEIPNLGHELPKAKHLAEAIAWLDG